MTDFRCRKCNHLLAKEEVVFGKVEIKCYACNELNVVEYEYPLNQVTYSAEIITINNN